MSDLILILESQMNFEKDDRGLVGVYEDEYQAKIRGEAFHKEKNKAIEDEISKLYKKICFALDSMTRMHFKPGQKRRIKDEDKGMLVDESVPVGINSYYTQDRIAQNDLHKTKK